MNFKIFQKFGFDTIHDLDNFLSREDVKQMIGSKKYDHYRELWLSNFRNVAMGDPKPKIKGKINWLGILASPIVWFSYRRMYGAAIGMILAITALIFAEQYFGFDTGTGIGAAMLGIAIMGKDMYFNHLVSLTKKIDAMPNQERVDQLLKWRGGASALFAVLAVPLFIVLAFVAVVLGSELSGNPI